jgi:hypothetical protein
MAEAGILYPAKALAKPNDAVLYQHLQPCYRTLLPKRYAKQVFGTTEVRRPLSRNASRFVDPILEVQDVPWLG